MGRNNADFYGIEYQYKQNPDGDHRVTAHHPEYGEIGTLYWSGKDGTIGWVHTHNNHLRRGVATGMYNFANNWAAENGQPRLRHSDSLTAEGLRWAQAVGGDVMSQEEWEDRERENGDL